MEQENQQGGIAEYFSELEHPSWHNKRHKLSDIMVIAICAMICQILCRKGMLRPCYRAVTLFHVPWYTDP